jgi:hypothetical protein
MLREFFIDLKKEMARTGPGNLVPGRRYKITVQAGSTGRS